MEELTGNSHLGWGWSWLEEITFKGSSSLEILQLQYILHVSLTDSWGYRSTACGGQLQGGEGDKGQARWDNGPRGHTKGKRTGNTGHTGTG